MHKDTVVVSCYYQLDQSKHSHSKYQLWMRHMLENVQNRMIVFVGDVQTKTYIQTLRGVLPILIEIFPFEQLQMYSYLDVWHSQWTHLDPEQKHHHPHLYILWNEKIHFLAKANKLLLATWYMWMDIGAFRCEPYQLTCDDIKMWLRDEMVHKRLSKTKLNLLQIDVISSDKKELIEKNGTKCSLYDFKHTMRNTGGTFVIPSHLIELWQERFYSLLNTYIKINRFAGKDQNLYANLLIAYPDEIHTVYSEKQCACSGPYDPWFYWHHFLHPRTPKPVWVTVLIPLYNQHNNISYLKECLESVYAQSYPMYNVIIGVNGVQRPEKQHQTYMKICSNIIQQVMKRESYRVTCEWFLTLGKGNTMNAMVQNAKVPEDLDYDHRFAILDVDNVWLPEKLAIQIYIIHNFEDKYDVIGTACQYFGDIQGTPTLPYGDVTNHDFFKVNPIINSSALIRKEDAYWSNEFAGLNDYNIWMKLKYQKRRSFYNIQHVLVKHRIYNNSSFNASGVQESNP